MKVLVLTPSYPTAAEPIAGIFVREHVRAVAEHVDIAVLHLHRDPTVRTVRAEPLVDEPGWRVRYPYSPKPLSLALHFEAARRGLRLARRRGFVPDVVHAHFFLAALPAALARRPIVASEHWSVFLPDDPARLSAPMARIARFSLDRARLVLPVSEALARELRALGVRAPMEVVPNAVDERVFRPGGPPREPRLLNVALHYEAKGIDVLLRALAQLPAGIELDLVGDGPLRPAHEALAGELGLGDRVVFHGLQPKERVAELMRASSLFVLPSRYDNNPCVLLEALVSGLPLVATRVGGVPEVVGGNGVLAAAGDPAALARGIGEALERDWDRAAIAAEAGGRYGAAAVGRRLVELYERAQEPAPGAGLPRAAP